MAKSTTDVHGASPSTTRHPSPPSITLPVEMTDIQTSQKPGAAPAATTQQDLNDIQIPASSPIDTSFAAAPATTTATTTTSTTAAASAADATAGGGDVSKSAQSLDPAPSASQSSNNPLSPDSAEPATTTTTTGAAAEASPPAITRLDSVAIGPSIDDAPMPVAGEAAGPVLIITLLLTSGARHPYKIDERYLTKRNVTVPEMTESGKKDPFSISVYTLKELILREWREEWEAAPSSPSSIRLIYFGRLLDDKTPLKECRFNAETANVVHMTVRPQDIVDDEEASKGKTTGRERTEGESTAGCRCVIL